ncbi:MAG: DeoR/GlpR family DNA-binding transcription regulator [Clostridia bacterium]
MKQSKSVVRKRQKELITLFDESGNLLVSDACAKLGVSAITIRRDLEQLEQQQLVLRYHSGARLVKQQSPSIPQLFMRDRLQMEQKQHIAKYVAGLVSERKTIFLNAGSTTYLVMKELVNTPNRIITNNVHAIDLFGNENTSNQAELIMTGGEYNAHNCSFLGDMALPLLSKMHADLCILGVNGINSNDGITTYSYQETLLNQAMVENCNGQHIVVADGTKIGKFFCFTSTTLDCIDLLVTDSTADPAELQRIRNAGVQIILADRPNSDTP